MRDDGQRNRRAASCRQVLRQRLILASVAGLLIDATCAGAQAPAAQGASRPQGGTIHGRVLDQTGEPVVGARVSALGAARAALARDSGRYAITGLAPGRYVIQAVRLGFAPSTPDTVQLAPDESIERDLRLSAVEVPLSRVVITPGSFSLLDVPASSQQSITREALLTMPQLAEDLFRSLNRLPGLSGSDFTAKVRIRNAGVDEQLVLLDGVELLEPFHLKDFDGALSILDAEAIGRVDLTTGGFGAQFGNRTTGVVQLASAEPVAGRTRSSLGLSLSNARARTEGSFAHGRGSWLASARRGYLDILFKLIDVTDAPDPTYYDAFGKVQYQLGRRNVLSAHALLAGDALVFKEDNDFVRSSYDNVYLWTTLRSQWTERLSAATQVSLTHLTWNRTGRASDRFFDVDYATARVDDDRRLTAVSFKQDWTFDVGSSLGLLAGGEARSERANYDYDRATWQRALAGRTVVTVDSQIVTASVAPSGARLSGYATVRVKPTRRLTSELGMRADRHGWTHQTTVDPRFNVALDVTRNTTLRGAWGVYSQAHALQELSVVDGEIAFAPAERAEQRVIAVEQQLFAGVSLRAEAFERRTRHPRARWFNTDGDLNAVPEVELDRIRLAPASARAHGVELLARYDGGGPFRASVSHARSKATGIISGVVTALPFDEPHSTAFDIAYRTRGGWTWALAWTNHSGWPHIPASFVADTVGQAAVVRRLTPTPIFTERLAPYQRVDVRLSRSFAVRRGQISLFADIFNVTNRANQRGYSYFAQLMNGAVVVGREREDFLPRLPALGLRWDF